jgi:hypothetical protein
MNPTNRRILIALLLLVGVLVSYYRTHPINLDLAGAISGLLLPDAPLQPGALLAIPLDTLPMLLLALVGGGLGRAGLRLLTAWRSGGQAESAVTSATPFVSRLSRPERLALEGLIGLGLLSSAALLIGLAGQFNRPALWGLVALVGAVTWRGLVGWARDLLGLLGGRSASVVPAAQSSGDAPGRVWEMRLLLGFIALMLALSLLHALIPPVAFDAVNYHLVGPSRYLTDGAIRAQADNHFLGFPQGVEILYGVAMSLFGRDTAAAPIHGWFGVLALLAIGGLVTRYLGALAGCWTVALTLTAWSLWLLFGWPYVDLAMVAYGAGILVVAGSGQVAGTGYQVPGASYEPSAISDQRSATSHQPPTTSHQPSATSDQRSATSHQPPATSHQRSATSHQPPATSHPLPATSHQPPATSHQPPAISYQPSATSHQPPATSYQPSATSHQPLATSHQLSTIDYRLSTTLGLLLGLAVGVKYTAAGLALALGVWLLLQAMQQRGWGSRLRHLLTAGLVIGGVAALAYLPWAFKGLLLYQNPVYPFVFGGLNWDALRATTFSTAGQGLLNIGAVGQWLTLPLAATIQGVEKGDPFGFTIGPWLLTLPLLLLVSWRWLDARARDLAWLALAFALPALAFWMAMAATSGIGAQTRLALFGLPPAAVLTGIAVHGLGRIPSRRLPLRLIAQAILGLTLLLTLLGALQETGRDGVLPYLTGQLDRRAMLERGLGVYAVLMEQLASLPPGSQVRFLYEPKTYHCPPGLACLGDILFDYWVRPLRQGAPDAAAVLAGWRAAGDDYLVVSNTGYAFWQSDPRFLTENARFPELLAALGDPLWQDGAGAYSLYALGS